MLKKSETTNFDELCNPVLIVGSYRLWSDDGKYYIQHSGGEGGEFSVDEIEKAIRSIWNV